MIKQVLICGLKENYINILTEECDFEKPALNYKKIHNTAWNKYCIFKDKTQLEFIIFLVINNYISFMEIKNLIKNLTLTHSSSSGP